MERESFERLQDVMTEAGELKQKADYDNLVNNTFAEAAKAKRLTPPRLSQAPSPPVGGGAFQSPARPLPPAALGGNSRPPQHKDRPPREGRSLPRLRGKHSPYFRPMRARLGANITPQAQGAEEQSPRRDPGRKQGPDAQHQPGGPRQGGQQPGQPAQGRQPYPLQGNPLLSPLYPDVLLQIELSGEDEVGARVEAAAEKDVEAWRGRRPSAGSRPSPHGDVAEEVQPVKRQATSSATVEMLWITTLRTR